MLEALRLLYLAISSKEPLNFKVRFLDADENLAIVSDLHLFRTKSPGLLGSFLRSSGIRKLVVAGDMFDDLEGAMGPEELRPYLRAALRYLRIPDGTEIHYIVSRHSHDPTPFPGTQSHSLGNALVKVYSGPLVIRGHGLRIFCTHGDEFVKKGYAAYAINMLARSMGHGLLVERLSRERVLKGWDEWFVMGHTHFPGMDPENKLANAGAWASPLRKATNSALTVTDRGVRLFYLGR
ncbi:MAG: hypothetical protein B9J98_02440 [Candidatus Terraquivivens tikiterensis]|uniref:Calcineurin-like phosphoesterase domain-containing protein n=1 Tax=Candidatus Terraquivivens tikiterensis TaxID=1980982 RepID=A0A2R7Y8G1_9ARCH|nr:MAG: hypothetical protein B9J98_02440 [Candidatus Terraquivivens tikiterensis]